MILFYIINYLISSYFLSLLTIIVNSCYLSLFVLRMKSICSYNYLTFSEYYNFYWIRSCISINNFALFYFNISCIYRHLRYIRYKFSFIFTNTSLLVRYFIKRFRVSLVASRSCYRFLEYISQLLSYLYKNSIFFYWVRLPK